MSATIPLLVSITANEDKFIRQKLEKHQTMKIETSGDLYNHTILFPDHKDVKIVVFHGDNPQGRTLGAEENGIVGYGKSPVKALVTANKEVEVTAYAAFFQQDESAQQAILYTDPHLQLTFRNNADKIATVGFNPPSSPVLASMMTSGLSMLFNFFDSHFSFANTILANMPHIVISPSRCDVIFNVRPAAEQGYHTPLVALVKGNKRGAIVTLKPGNEVFKPKPAPQPELNPQPEPHPQPQPETQQPPATITATPQKEHNHHHHKRGERGFHGESMGHFISFAFGMGFMALIFALCAACKKCKNPSLPDNEAIPPIMGVAQLPYYVPQPIHPAYIVPQAQPQPVQQPRPVPQPRPVQQPRPQAQPQQQPMPLVQIQPVSSPYANYAAPPQAQPQVQVRPPQVVRNPYSAAPVYVAYRK